MKELSIQEKAQLYDEAIKRANELLYVSDKESLQYKAIKHILPYLKESDGEDDKIRNAILKYLTKMWSNCQDDVCGVNVEDAIVWLEKQGESDETKAKMFLMNKGYPIDANGIFPTYEEMYNIIKDGLEMQSEQKQLDYENANINQKDFVLKQEPKFKIGDWVVDNCDYIWKIEGILNQFYILEGIEGSESRPTIEWVNKTFHLWTIQDAKDGDVLVVPQIKGSEHTEQIFIFKEIKDRNYVKNAIEYYCRVVDNEFCVNERGFMGQSDDYFVPATKEQRDLLFQKMKDTGYEWDANKKKVKKVCKIINFS